MKFRSSLLVHAVIAIASLPLAQLAAAAGHSLRVGITPRFAGAPLVFDALAHTNAAGQKLSVTRLDFLLSRIALHRKDGLWDVRSNIFAYVCSREGRTDFTLADLATGTYDRIRFQVGVPFNENHAAPAVLAPEHPLNPNVNGLHWSWQGGYVFLAVEGNWRTPSETVSGYSFHLATDSLLMTVELPLMIQLSADHELSLALNVEDIFAALHPIRFTTEAASTHSRSGDPMAHRLRENIERAFSIASIRAAPIPQVAMKSKAVVEISSTATPYRLTIPGYFPRPALPFDNPLTDEGVELGRRLFQDPRLSVNNHQSCASCHQADTAFAETRRFSAGALGDIGSRNAMPLFNLAWKNSYFWDGRAASLREQVLQPIENPAEMHESLSNVVAKLCASRPRSADKPTASSTREAIPLPTMRHDYPTLFARAFGTAEITADRIARALEQFLLIQVSHDSRFDRWLGGTAELTDEEKRGFELFNTEYDPRRGQYGADCFHCHGGPLFQSQTFANNGLDTTFSDRGRANVTGRPGDEGKFATPSLRNIARTAPYMHDGRFATLEEVIRHYSERVKRSDTLDANLAKRPDGDLHLSTDDQAALVAFLKTLTDERMATPAPTVATLCDCP